MKLHFLPLLALLLYNFRIGSSMTIGEGTEDVMTIDIDGCFDENTENVSDYRLKSCFSSHIFDSMYFTKITNFDSTGKLERKNQTHRFKCGPFLSHLRSIGL